MNFKGSTVSRVSSLFRRFGTAGSLLFDVALDDGFELASRCVLERAWMFVPEDQEHVFQKLCRIQRLTRFQLVALFRIMPRVLIVRSQVFVETRNNGFGESGP